MGFLGSFNPVKIISNIAKNPLQATQAAVLTGGTSLVSPQISKLVSPITQVLSSPQVLGAAAAVATGVPMGFNVGGFLGGVSSILGQSSLGQLQGLGQIAGALAPAFQTAAPQPQQQQGQVIQMQAQRVAGSGGMTQEVWLAASKLLSKVGIAPATVAGFMSALHRVLSSLARLARHTPVGTLVSVLIGVGLAVQEANTLVAWWSTKRKRRRMNAGNAKALRRAVRRLKSFDRMSARVYARLHIGRGASTRARRRGRVCVTCRRDPCQC